MNLTTRYLGLPLAHPIVASASPLTATLDGMRRLEDAGAAAIVMASLYEEQIRAEDTAYALYTEHGSNSQAEAGTYFPELVEQMADARSNPRYLPAVALPNSVLPTGALDEALDGAASVVIAVPSAALRK